MCDWIEPPAANNLATAAGVPPDSTSPGSGGDGVPHRDFWARYRKGPGSALLARLAWATVGYHFQWTERRYDPEKRSPLPADLGRLAADLAGACGWALEAEAAILNLYSPSSTMGGHLDDAEPCQAVPIVSLSLGLEAIYMLGGATKAEPAIAMTIRSGDVIVQGGKSRGYVHGVPRIMAGSLPESLRPEAIRRHARGRNDAGGPPETDVEELTAVAHWLSEHRLNINVRQVYDGESAAPAPAPAAERACGSDASLSAVSCTSSMTTPQEISHPGGPASAALSAPESRPAATASSCPVRNASDLDSRARGTKRAYPRGEGAETAAEEACE